MIIIFGFYISKNKSMKYFFETEKQKKPEYVQKTITLSSGLKNILIKLKIFF